jgi:hypothetical protein
MGPARWVAGRLAGPERTRWPGAVLAHCTPAACTLIARRSARLRALYAGSTAMVAPAACAVTFAPSSVRRTR